MRSALTAISVKRLKPPAKGQIDVFNTGYNGLALRVSYGGGKSWRWYARVNGKLRAITWAISGHVARRSSTGVARCSREVGGG